MQTVEQRHIEAARALADYAGFKFAADHLDMAISATAEAFARFEASLPPSAPADRDAKARELLAAAYLMSGEPKSPNHNRGKELREGADFHGREPIAIRAIIAALALPPSGIAEMVRPINEIREAQELALAKHFYGDLASITEMQKQDIAFAIDEIYAIKPKSEHWSDCAIHNDPADPCDCGGFDARSWQAGLDAAVSHQQGRDTQAKIKSLLDSGPQSVEAVREMCAKVADRSAVEERAGMAELTAQRDKLAAENAAHMAETIRDAIRSLDLSNKGVG